jgi:hypothetical protein
MARAYDHCTPWTFRRQAQMRFIDAAKEAQRAVHKLTGKAVEGEEQLAAKLQLSAFHTSYPSRAQVAIGHTVFLELQAITQSISRDLVNRSVLKGTHDFSQYDPKALLALVRQVTDALAVRAVLEEASRHPELAEVEYYRLFEASQCSMKFPRLADCVKAVVLFGDFLPDVDSLALHRMTRQMLGRLIEGSRDYLCALPCTDVCDFSTFFQAWTRSLVRVLAPHLPRRRPEPEQGPGETDPRRPGQDVGADDQPLVDCGPGAPETAYRYGNEEETPDAPDILPPFDAPRPPALSTAPSPEKTMHNILNAIQPEASQEAEEAQSSQPDPRTQELMEAIAALQQAALQSSAQTSAYGDKREDLLEQELAARCFSAGPIEGSPTEGHMLEFELGDETVGGQIEDRIVEFSDDWEAVRKLETESAPIVSALRRNLYPSEEELTRIEHIHSSGCLDPKRLPVAGFCEASFRRFRSRKEPSPAGKAVLLTVADISASLSDPQMGMCKLLMASWARSVRYSNMHFLAALYHSERRSTPLVQWVYHPFKTPASSPIEAVRAVASLPNEGTGAQSDALSLKYVLDQAVGLAKGSHIYVTLISDCDWNKCFPETEKTAEEEVADVLAGFQDKLGDRLHITLVALEDKNQKQINGLVDKRLVVDDKALSHPEMAAEKIGRYVASCIRERRRTPARRT